MELLLLLRYLIEAFNVYVIDVFFQKLTMTGLPPVDLVGDDVHGKTIIVTGPTSGIGKETAAALYRRGAEVVLACRDEARADMLMRELQASHSDAASLGSLRIEMLDLGSLDSVRAFVERWRGSGAVCDVLLNNAGIFSMGAPRSETADGFESHLGTNHLAPFLLTLLMLPLMAPTSGRVVTVSSMLHRVGALHRSDPHLSLPGAFNPERAYSQSKLANILMTRELRRRLPESSGLAVLAVHPGEVLTGVVRSLPPLVQSVYQLLFSRILLTAQQGARASVYAASAKSAPAAAEATQGYINSNCQPAQPSAAGRDDAAAEWLWAWSAAQVKLPPGRDLPAVECMDVGVDHRKRL